MTLVGGGQREETNGVRREVRGPTRGWSTAHQRCGIMVVVEAEHMSELMRDDVAHRVRQRERWNIRTADSHDAPTSRPPAHTERDQVGLRQRDHYVRGFIGERLEEPSGCRPAAEDRLSACATRYENHVMTSTPNDVRGQLRRTGGLERTGRR